MANISPPNPPEEQISRLLSLIGQPARIQILQVIGTEAACVCHIEAALGMRQASISQHLMVLRKAELVTTHRDRRNIFYRLARSEILQILDQAASLLDIDAQEMRRLAAHPVPNCSCPLCNPGIDSNLTCQKIRFIAKK